MLLVDRYIARLMIWPLTATLLTAAMLLLLDRMQRLFDFVVREGGPVGVAWSMLANTVPGYLSLAFPVALLMGVLLTFRRLAVSSELDVLRSSGLSYFRLLRVPYGFAVVLAIANAAVIGFVQPHARYVNEALRFDLQSGALGAQIRPGEFHTIGRREMLRTEAVGPDGRTLIGLFLRGRNARGERFAVSAERALVMAAADGDALVLRLNHGVLMTEGRTGRPPGVLAFASHDLRVPLPALAAFRARGTGRAEEYTLPELATRRHSGDVDPAERRQADAELQFRLVEIATMFVVPLLALALGIPPKRSTSALGVFLSVLILVTWFKIDQYGAEAAAAGRVDPVTALWGPLALFAALCAWMAHRLDRRPGAQPTGALEAGWRRLRAVAMRWRRPV